jgi:hypothetical protein
MPVHVEKYVAAASTRGAEVILLDPEDSVPADMNGVARRCVRDALTVAGRGGARLRVRINRESWSEDITASIWPGISEIVLPKGENPGLVRLACVLIERLEAERNLDYDSVGLLVTVETARGLENAASMLTAHRRVRGIAGLADVDFPVDLGIFPDPLSDQLEWARGELDLLVRMGDGRGLARWVGGLSRHRGLRPIGHREEGGGDAPPGWPARWNRDPSLLRRRQHGGLHADGQGASRGRGSGGELREELEEGSGERRGRRSGDHPEDRHRRS